MDLQLWFWAVARATGLASYAALCLSVLSGVALRTSVLDFLAHNRALRALHDFVTYLWIPLGLAHVTTLILDHTAQIRPVDAVVPFLVGYGTLAIGLGTISFDLAVVIIVTSWLRRRMDDRLWRWIHRTSYVAFATVFLHSYLSGTDFDAPIVSAFTWSAALGLAVFTAVRVVWGRLPE
ncbi:MAG TPA: ferric reductase-like transmembrane domain-containing protein [Candidatus Limnocylindria bacterium]